MKLPASVKGGGDVGSKTTDLGAHDGLVLGTDADWGNQVTADGTHTNSATAGLGRAYVLTGTNHASIAPVSMVARPGSGTVCAMAALVVASAQSMAQRVGLMAYAANPFTGTRTGVYLDRAAGSADWVLRVADGTSVVDLATLAGQFIAGRAHRLQVGVSRKESVSHVYAYIDGMRVYEGEASIMPHAVPLLPIVAASQAGTFTICDIALAGQSTGR